MGIMTRLYHRSGGLTENRYKYFFMDIGENIHIHYRDLRIELSVPEFLEFAEVFERCAPEVRKKIDGGYQDGVLPNTNESNTWTSFAMDTILKHPVKYNPNRISIEENLDGYHIHFRNYKLLFDKASFDNILQAMNDVVEKRTSKRTLDEILHLIAYNDLEYRLIEANRDTPPYSALVEVEPKYLGKIKQMFAALGFSAAVEGGRDLFRNGEMEFCIRVGDGKGVSQSSAALASTYVSLADYFAAMKGQITHKDINLLMLPVLNAFGMVRAGVNRYINLDFRSFLLDREKMRVIFQTLDRPYAGNLAEDSMQLSRYMHSLGLFLAKPKKTLFTEDKSEAIRQLFMRHTLENIASNPCVERIYVLGSSTRNSLGQYEVPLVHFGWAKLASDFDILIEIDEAHAVPAEWERQFFADFSGSYYYLLGDLPHPIESPYTEQYPHVRFFNHLIEAYLFFPSSCKKEVKDSYLANIKAELIYERSSAASAGDKKKVRDSDGAGQISELMREAYGLASPDISRIELPSYNDIYKVADGDDAFIVKVYGDKLFVPQKQGSKAEHIRYEDDLLKRLEACVPQAISPVPGRNGRSIHEVGARKAMVFHYVDGGQFDGSVAHIRIAAGILAKVHLCLPENAIATRDFDYQAFLSAWLKHLQELRKKPRFGECVRDVEGFDRMIKQVSDWLEDAYEWERLDWVHGHADVNPRNFLFLPDDAYVFDFQVARLMPRLSDIAGGMIEFGFSGDTMMPERMAAFLEYYEAVYPLGAIERKHIDEFLRAEAMTKVSSMLEAEVSHGYRVNPARMDALLDICMSRTAGKG